MEERIRFIMQGTPLNFAAIAKTLCVPEAKFKLELKETAELVTGILWVPGPPVMPLIHGGVGPSGSRIKVQYLGGGPRPSYRADFEAILLSDNRTLVKVLSNDKSWIHVEFIWQALAAELEQLGFLLPQNATELAEPEPEQVARREQSTEDRIPNKQAAMMGVYFFRGTLARFKSELELSGIDYQIWTEKPAHLIVRIGNFLPPVIQARVKGRGGGPRIRTPQGHVTSVWMPLNKSKSETAKGIITAIEHDDDFVRLEVGLEDNPDEPGYSEVHERWATLRRRLGTRLLDKEPMPKSGGVQKRKGGRPRDANDDWAWNQVNELKRNKKEVYREWLERIGDRAMTLSDTWDSFTKAIKEARGPGE